ncbi:MAG: adenine deaminase [Bacteroidales bacterium]|nr:adenine deaminase [Bacteroidales bacterium]
MNNKTTIISGNIIDIINKKIFKGEIIIVNNKISKITEKEVNDNTYILPGLIDAHIHIESSMLLPSEFAKVAALHGTVATISDPHEIANVLGTNGVLFMINNGKSVPFKFYFGAPSCVPATTFETSGYSITAEEIEKLLKMDDILYLSEMMNFPGVIFKDKEIIAKLALAKKYNKPVDGHAPGLIGENADIYINSGITTDHECFDYNEAEEKILKGMKILIREGSAAKNFDSLFPLIDKYPDNVMLCSDDKHPDDLIKGHINLLIKKALDKNLDLFNILRACTLNPVRHYGLDTGLLQEGDSADLIIIDNLKNFNILSTYINGELVADKGKSLIQTSINEIPNNFNCKKIKLNDIEIKAESQIINCIEVIEGQLITKALQVKALITDNKVISDIQNDILKIIVLNRYKPAKPAIAFIKNFGIKQGAIASAVAHDSHNIIAVGASDSDLIKVINLLIENKGGIAYIDNSTQLILPLKVGGIMSTDNAYLVAEKYKAIEQKAKEAGSKLKAPLMTLSFMALLVIPELKLSDKGLFDTNKFTLTNLFIKNN